MFELGPEVVGSTGQAGISTYEDWQEYAKSVQASSYQTDHAALFGMSALRVESLEPTLRAIVSSSDSFTFYKSLKRMPVTSAVHEYMVQTSRGGQADGMNIGELGEVQFDVGDYARKVERIKLFATGAAITHFASVQQLNGPQLRARENENANIRLLNSIERGLFHSDERVSPNKINGVFTQIETWQGGKNVRDLAGSSDANELAQVIIDTKATVRQEGYFGDVNTVFLDAFAQTALDKALFPQWRVQISGNSSELEYGAPVAAIKTSYGNITLKNTMWSDNAENSKPYIVKSGGKLPDKVPAQPTLTLTGLAGPQPGGAKGWTAARAGTYFYAITYVDADGREGQPSILKSATVAATGAIRVAGAAGVGGNTPTGARIYRGPQDFDGAPTLADLRKVTEVPVLPDGTFVYDDVNQYIPGSSHTPVLNMDPKSIEWLQLRPTTQFPLYQSNSLRLSWAVLQYGTLMLAIPQHHFYVKNFVPKNAPWQPFKAA